MRWLRSLYVQVLLGVVLGVVLGHVAPEVGVQLRPLGDAFVRLVKMLVGPIVFCTVVVGTAGMRDLKKLGRVGAKAFVYFEVLTTVALLLGLAVANLVGPGEGMNVDPRTLDGGALAEYARQAQQQKGFVAFLLDLIPHSFFDAFARGDLLQILLCSLLFGVALSALGEPGRPVVALVDGVSQVFFRIVGFVMRLAPLAALGAMAFTVGHYGLESLSALAKLLGTFYLTCLLFVALGLGAVCRLLGFRLWRLVVHLKDEFLIVLATSSSEAALPRLLDKLERLGCGRAVVGVVVPSGYSFNLDGTSIYLTMACLFVAQAMNVELALEQQLSLLAVLLLSSKGAAGVTGSGFITLAATLAAVPTIPVVGLTLILGVDRFLSEARALTNLVGNAVATVAIARWEGELDQARLRQVLAGEPAPLPAGNGEAEAAAGE